MRCGLDGALRHGGQKCIRASYLIADMHPSITPIRTAQKHFTFYKRPKALENFPLLMYILAAKTLILCLAFAGVKMYQSKKIEEKLKREREEKLKREAEKKGD
ncbi:hypothetical protein ASZ78_014282 [Callipepla squamata]|uniref:Small integral membrane protein 11A n=1 Tax=Callipepla squamata TaxID=9009 RepID=A0A226NLS1_CALSU|nr:hypothetical protein ASZ78_014282 [Callipepla squamata]